MPEYELTLYVMGSSKRSSTAAAALQALCDAELAGRYALEIVDVRRRPDMAERDKIIATPTLIKRSPAPERRILGDLEDRTRLRLALDLDGAALRARGAEAGAASEARREDRSGERPGVDRPLDILVIEDNPGDVRLLKEALRDAPIRSTQQVVEDGEAALALLTGHGPEGTARREREPDLIVLDLQLPRLHGLNVLSALKGDPGLRRIPVAIFTGTADAIDVMSVYNRGANCLIAKPRDIDDYTTKVRQLLQFWSQTATLPAL
jgi:CheY-like chemotaxis protein